MATILEEAQAYEPKQTKNIADLEKVSVNMQLEDREGEKKAKGDEPAEKFTYKVAIVDDQEYRVPNVVLGNLKDLLEANPGMTHFKVVRKGSGLETRYTVVPIMEEASASSPSYPKVVNVILPTSPESQKTAYAKMMQMKASLQDKFLLGMLSYEQHAEMVSLAEEEYNSKCQ